MNDAEERRESARLPLSYPIRVLEDRTRPRSLLGHTVTRNLSARGVFFRTFHAEPFHQGRKVHVVISVPHRMASDGREVQLDLEGAGRVVRVDDPGAEGLYGEDGVALTGVALAFDRALGFESRWA